MSRSTLDRYQNKLGRPNTPMLHTKSQGDRPSVSGEDFKDFFTIYGRDGHLGLVTRTI